jgi:hypothetical protein
LDRQKNSKTTIKKGVYLFFDAFQFIFIILHFTKLKKILTFHLALAAVHINFLWARAGAGAAPNTYKVTQPRGTASS